MQDNETSSRRYRQVARPLQSGAYSSDEEEEDDGPGFYDEGDDGPGFDGEEDDGYQQLCFIGLSTYTFCCHRYIASCSGCTFSRQQHCTAGNPAVAVVPGPTTSIYYLTIAGRLPFRGALLL